MRTSGEVEMRRPQAIGVKVSKDFLTVTLHDGRVLSVPLEWYPRLFESTSLGWKNWRLLDDGRGIRWDDIDEDISIAGLLAGRASGESEKSLARWRAARERVNV